MVLPIEKFPSLILPRKCNNVMFILLSNFCSIICQVIAYGRLKTKEKFKHLGLKVVAVTYKRFQMQRFDLETDR